jgi:hypothetical protein
VTDSIAIVIHADSNYLILVDDVVHIPIHEVGVVFTLYLIDHKCFLIFTDNAHLLIVVEDVEISCLLQRAEIKVESPLEAWVPRSG